MSYSNLLQPRPSVLSDDGIEGIVDLANLKDQRHRKLEAKPEQFFGLTYPTNEIRRVVEKLQLRFARRTTDTPALFLFEGLKGSGKSHLLVLAYHLLRSPSQAQTWLTQHNLALNAPHDAIVVVHKYTDRPLARVWDFIFQEANITIRGSFDVYPSPNQILEALGDRHLIVILDELEQGVRMIGNEALRRQNISFLQMLSELGNRNPQVTLMASVYDAGEEPGLTLIRVPNVRVQFARATLADRARVVLHRVFENFLTFDRYAAMPVIESLLNIWQRHLTVFDLASLKAQLLDSYPFHPELLRLILERVPARGGFQNIRGSLGFLANLVRLTYQTQDIVTAAHGDLSDRETTTRLHDLDPSGDLINRARANMEELATAPLAHEIAATTLLHTLAGDGRMRGATREELIRHVVLPGTDINDFEQTLMSFQRYASHFHLADGRYFFDLEEKADSKVEFRSLTIDPNGSRARQLLRELWVREVFREAESTIVFTSADEAKATIEQMRKDRLRIVLAPRRLHPDERHNLYFGLSVRNQVLLLEPKAEQFDLDSNADLRKWAQRSLAAAELAAQAEHAQDRDRQTEYERIGRGDRSSIADAIKRAGLQYIRFESFGATSTVDHIEPESMSGAAWQDVSIYLSQSVYPAMVLQEHIVPRFEQVKNKTVREVEKQYKDTLCFPVPMNAQSVPRAIRELCASGHIGIYHPRGNFSRQNPSLTDQELLDATIGDPVDAAPPPPVHLPPVQPPTAPPGLAQLLISPAGPLSMVVATSQQLTIEASDAQGRLMPAPMAAWRTSAPANATISSTGLLTAVAAGSVQITAVAGAIVSRPLAANIVAAPVETIAVPPKPSAVALRQEIAVRLAGISNVKVKTVRFQVFSADQEVDLATLSPALRGSLSGSGTVSAEINITKVGAMTKAQVEQLCEQLPQLRGGQYSARLEITQATE